jgi:flagellar hook-associated protein 3 FlgL
MRVATNSYTDSMLNEFSQLKSQQATLQNEVTTGLSVESPSDNPGAMSTTLSDLSNQSTQIQYNSNISTLSSQADNVYSVLQSLQSIVSQASTISTEAGSTTAGTSQLTDYSSQVTSLIQQAVQLLNSQDPATGQYLFGGTDSGQPPYSVTTDSSGNVTGVTYNGNSSTNQVEIAPGQTVSAGVPGSNTTGTGAYGLVTDSRTGADLFNHLISLQNDLASGDSSAASTTDNANLQKDEDNMTYQVANNGNIQSQLNTAASLATTRTNDLSTDISNTSGADMVTALSQLNQTQTAYQAALESSATIMQLSILDFIS